MTAVERIIQMDNLEKLKAILHLQRMMDALSVYAELEPIYDDRIVMTHVRVKFPSGGEIDVNVEGDSPLTLVREVIMKARLS